MHIQQTKAASRRSGGPQYYFHSVPSAIKDYLRRKGACDVVLQTPYGIASTPFKAVGRDHKLDGDQLIRGSVGHDRIQQAQGTSSIGEAIREWYCLRQTGDIARVDVDVELHPDGHFILAPLSVHMRNRTRPIVLDKPYHPLAFTQAYQAPLWKRQIALLRQSNADAIGWAVSQIEEVVGDHAVSGGSNIKEEDLLRASGALSILGVHLSAYVGRGYDCPKSWVRMLDYPAYHCPVEIKKRSQGFNYQILRYNPLPRALLLCTRHDLRNPPDHVDVVELTALARYLNSSEGV
ncbi:MAG: hypothetical protein PHR35_12175 [Kiritimatiellae bacterium]|nr:hypothetical protein [Kiritimatiellia bacterium]